MCNSKNHSSSCTCGFGGYGHRGRRSFANSSAVCFSNFRQPNRSWRLESLGHPLTYPITCWWCPEQVFFHTNGNGDCVLLDAPLGRPWHVHECWKQRRHRELFPVATVESTLLDSDFDGQTYTASGEYVSAPKNGAGKISVRGYISQNAAQDSDREELDLSCFQDCPGFPWCSVVVRDAEGSLFPFVVPIATARKLSLYSIVRVTGRWVCMHAVRRLIAERVTILNYPSDRQKLLRVLTLGMKRVSCAYCGKTVVKGKMGH